jgi:glycosyltransferase involved in cell wall biosynthesis
MISDPIQFQTHHRKNMITSSKQLQALGDFSSPAQPVPASKARPQMATYAAARQAKYESDNHPLRVLMWPACASLRSHPYNLSLYVALEETGVAVRDCSTSRLMLDRWDVIHVHWPDLALQRKGATEAAAQAASHLLALSYAKSRGARIIWTVHEVSTQSSAHPQVERWFWDHFLPLVDSTIHLSRAGLERAFVKFPALASRPRSVIAHGHYRGCYPDFGNRATARRELALEPEGPVISFIGKVTAAKAVPQLAAAFIEAAIPNATLLLAGETEASSEAAVRRYCNQSPRIRYHAGRLPKDELPCYLQAADLAVIPVRDSLDTGSALLALSFNRPVLVPRGSAPAELHDLVGSRWVMTYEGELTGAVLRRALDWARHTTRPMVCDLSMLEREGVAHQIRANYFNAVNRVPAGGTSFRPAMA